MSQNFNTCQARICGPCLETCFLSSKELKKWPLGVRELKTIRAALYYVWSKRLPWILREVGIYPNSVGHTSGPLFLEVQHIQINVVQIW